LTFPVLSVRIRGHGRPVVLLPWFGLDRSVTQAAFEPVFAGVHGWRRIYLDLPGTGRSRPVGPSSDAVLDAVEETVAAAVGPEPFLLAGCSYGGYLAAGLARRSPERLLGMLLVCSGVRILPAHRNLDRVLPSAPEADWLRGVPADLQPHFSHAIGHQTRAVADRTAAAFALAAPTDDAYLDALRTSGYPLSDEASDHRFAGDVLLLAGRQDRIAGHLDQFDALARYPGGSYTALAGAGHYLPFEQPERFAGLSLDWLARSRVH
jgi:pimeloyl-ACP methyl ester carboxylesterase